MLTAVIALAAIAVAGGPGLAQAQTLRIALREDADLLDPTLARTYVGRIVFAGLCDKLFDRRKAADRAAACHRL
jgi:peptide/nickel transport system substrate-binding protein